MSQPQRFADEVSTNRHFGDSVEINISCKKLARFLNRAESREPTQGSKGHGAKSKLKTRKRKRSSSPFDQLRSADEAERQNQEAMTDKRIDAADDDFSSGTPVETHSQQPPRSTRQKFGEA